ncbi:MAG: type IVB secretion system coupling complex protein DotM/IcmP [Gammaproteobacteria bacterium]
MPAAGQAQPGSNDNALDFLWVIVMIVGAIILTWYFGRTYIVSFVFQVRAYEITAIHFVLESWSQLALWLHLPFLVPNVEDLVGALQTMKSSGSGADFQTLTDVSNTVGSYLRYPVLVLLVFVAVVLYMSNATLKFKSVFNMNRLKLSEMVNWPQITTVAKLDLVSQDIDQGPWAMPKTPMQFVKSYGLAREENNKEGRPSLVLLPGNAHRIFALQVGALWAGLEKLPIHTQALFAIFAARANRDREGADKLLKQIAISATNANSLNFTGTRELLNKHVSSKAVGRVVGSHAYALTVLASMLELARTDGVLASAEFLWLKPIDRRLWYMMNTVGRPTAVPEIAGAYAHWIAEKKMGRPLRVPMVDEAVKALDAALQDVIYEPDEE